MKRLRTEAAEFLRALIASCNPIAPTMWLPMARALSRCPGWMASMLLVALFGVTMFMSILIGQWFNGLAANVLETATWVSWGLVSCLAMSIGCVHAVRNLRRLGARSVLSFRMWFELSRLSWHLAFLGFVAAATVSFVAGVLNAGPVETFAWNAGKVAVEALLVVFAAAGLMGYILALGRWRIPTGRAFECVNFFLPLPAGGYLFFYAFDRWPPAAIWPDGIITAMIGAVGIAILSGSFVITVWRMQQFETRTKANTRVDGRAASYSRGTESPSA